ncbi:MAG: hypothetical protein CFH01_00863 [Alphaproteobacteria bacterium MarineAlpha2_Bin1]|nr:MAG: hypothetical protein CFH01_00863 [Alphaproteobacteria bacterium MarineAlpha2_Bin1]
MDNITGFIVLADISGYTKFVRSHNMKKIPFIGKQVTKTSESHAEHIISDLLEKVIEELEGTLTVNKLQGDAVLFYSNPENLDEYPKLLIDKINGCFEVFIKRLNDIIFCETCPCDACHQMGNLRLKSFVHYGDFLIKKVSRFEEIAGENVILAHRLMKNSIDADEYILFTDSVKKICNFNYLGKVDERIEKCDGLGDVPISVFYPEKKILENPAVDKMGVFSKFKAMNNYFKEIKNKKILEEKYGFSS